MKKTLLGQYDFCVESGRLTDDLPQREILGKLDALLGELGRTGKKRLIGFGRTETPRGLYIWGGVGSGKSMVMDMFAEGARGAGVKTARFHFHDFMIAVHDKIHDPRLRKKKDPAHHVAAAISGGARLICFDEMEVRDIADAMIIARVMEGFFESGGVLVSTSNRRADDLYLKGLHRERFLPFIELLKEKTDEHELVSGIDWRQRFLSGVPSWYVPDSLETRGEMEIVFGRLTNDIEVSPVTVLVAGREIVVEHAAGSVGIVSFADMCEQPYAARDYIALAARFSGLLICGIPDLGEELRNEARRFMWLVDAFYDRGRFLVCSSSSPLESLYSGESWSHEFPRTVSRLTEMTKI